MQPSVILSHSGPQVSRVILEERELVFRCDVKEEARQTYVGNTTRSSSARPCIRTANSLSRTEDPKPRLGTQNGAVLVVSILSAWKEMEKDPRQVKQSAPGSDR